MLDDRPILLSVIVPVYNGIDCLERCIDSIRRQNMPNMEILIINDGSTDNTGALCEKMALIDKRIRVFHKENGGSSSARNLGLDNARGEYLGFVDADDYIEPLMYERLLRAAMSEKLKIVQTSRDEIAQDGSRMPDVCTPPSEAKLYDSHSFMKELLLHRGDCSFCTKLVHSSLFRKRRFPEGELNEDFNLLVKMLPDVSYIGVLPFQDYHVFYRMGSNTRTDDENSFPQVFTDIVVNADRVKEIIDENYPELTEELERFRLFQRLDYMLHIPISMMKGSNEFYVAVKNYLHKNRFRALKNQYLTKKNKQYIFILGTAPKIARRLHRIKMRRKIAA